MRKLEVSCLWFAFDGTVGRNIADSKNRHYFGYCGHFFLIFFFCVFPLSSMWRRSEGTQRDHPLPWLARIVQGGP